MIEVPVRVKDALREGNLKKNYRFLVKSVQAVYSYVDDFTFETISDRLVSFRSNTYKWYSSDALTDLGTYVLTKESSEVITGNIVKGELIDVEDGDYLRISSMLSTSVILQKKIVSYEPVLEFTITNDNLVVESVKLDERMCTGNDIKFGLCEGSSLEFQYFGLPNITGKQIQAFIDVQYKDANGDLDWHEIPMGFFTVDQCPMQFSTGIRKVTAYNKLKSDYLDQKCNTELIQALDDPTAQMTILGIKNTFLGDYEVQLQNIKKVTVSGGSGHSGDGKNPLLFHVTDFDNYVTPINRWAFGSIYITPQTDVQLQIEPIGVSYANLDPDKYYQLIETKRKISDLQDYFVQYVSRMIDDAGLSITAAQFWDAYKNNPSTGWVQFSSVAVTDSNNVTKYYSDYAYNHGVSGIDGTIEDLCKMILHGITRINIRYPYRLTGYHLDPLHTALKVILYFWGDEDVRYQIGNTWPNNNYSSYPVFTYPDGENIPSTGYIYNDWLSLYELDDIIPADLITVDPQTIPDFTLRDLVSATYETVAQYGKLDRETDLFAGIELNNSRLLPSDTLYPSDSLYPNGNSVRGNRSMYSKLWTDSQGVQTFRYLIITYKGLDENNQEVEKVLQRTVNADGTTDYNMSDNWLFKNLVWSDSDVGDYADAMVLKMQSVSWFPFEMWCAGLPYLETGDELEITTSEGTYTSYVLQRQLNGIQNLQDTFIDGELDIF